MISKKKAIVGAVVIVILTTILNVTVGNFIAVRLDKKYIISEDTYRFYQDIQNNYSKLFQLHDYLLENYYQEIDPNTLVEGALEGMFDSIGDPYTDYLTKREMENMLTETEGSFGGIGVVVTPAKDGYVTVVTPIEDTPGERAGLITGDRIISVNGEKVTADQLDYAVKLMKGKPGTNVVLSVLREGREEPFEVDIKREQIKLVSVKSEVIDNIGYIRITSFLSETTAADFKQHLKALQQKNIKGLVIDIRGNGGGLLSQCVEIADVLLGEQIIVYTEDRQGTREVEKSDKNKVDLPLALLVNKGSASASEILAGAVKDGGQGTIVGTTTFGKGLVQQVKPLSDGTGFKYTISEYFTPNGTNIHGTGIEPDIEVKLPEELTQQQTIERKDDIQLQKALEVIQEKIQ